MLFRSVSQSRYGRGWKAGETKVDTAFIDGSFTVSARVREAELNNDFNFIDSVKPLIGDTNKISAPWKFFDLGATAVIVKTGGEIKDLHARGPLGRYLRFRGAWDRDGELAGLIDVASVKKWKVRGWDGKILLDSL